MKQQLENKYYEYKVDDEKHFPRGLVSPEVARKSKDGGGAAGGRGGKLDGDVKDKPSGMKKTDGPGGGGRTPVGNRRAPSARSLCQNLHLLELAILKKPIFINDWILTCRLQL